MSQIWSWLSCNSFPRKEERRQRKIEYLEAAVYSFWTRNVKSQILYCLVVACTSSEDNITVGCLPLATEMASTKYGISFHPILRQ